MQIKFVDLAALNDEIRERVGGKIADWVELAGF